MQKEDFYKYLMAYSYNNSAEVVKTCTCNGGCNHPNGRCPSGRTSLCWSKCLNEIYQHDTNPSGRLRYNCNKLVHHYLYRQLDKQASEMLVALREINDTISSFSEFNVISFGCGPCTELIALDYYNQENGYNKNINYMGIDIEPSWEIIHTKINEFIKQEHYNIDFKCSFGDATDINFLENLLNDNINIIVLNYIVSSLYSNSEFQKLNSLYSVIAELISRNNIKNCVIIINDMNLSIRGTNTFVDIITKLTNNEIRIINQKARYFEAEKTPIYGTKYSSNKTIFEDLFYPQSFPNNKSTSAQLLVQCGVCNDY